MKTISRSKLIELIKDIKGAMPIAFSAMTLADLKKTDNPFNDQEIYKFSRVQAFINFNYSNSVNRQLEREGKASDFKSSARVWGEHISSAIIKKDDKFYLATKIEKTRTPIYFNSKKIISEKKIKPFLPAEKPTSQGLEKKVVYRNYSIDSIVSISINKEKYKVV